MIYKAMPIWIMIALKWFVRLIPVAILIGILYVSFDWNRVRTKLKSTTAELLETKDSLKVQTDTAKFYKGYGARIDAQYEKGRETQEKKVKAATRLISRQTPKEDQAYILKVASPDTKPDTTGKPGTIVFTDQQTKDAASKIAEGETYKDWAESVGKKAGRDSTRRETEHKLILLEFDMLIEDKPFLNIGYGKRVKKAKERIEKVFATPL